MRGNRPRFAALGAAVAVLALLAGCGSGSSGSSDSASSSGLQTVTIGITPYFEYQPWIIAHSLGLDKQQGLNFQFVKYTGYGANVSAMLRGSVDLGAGCNACNYPYYKSAPQLRDWMTTDQYKGFVLIGRKGQALTLSQAEKTMSPAAAKAAVLRQLKGKSFAIVDSYFQATVDSAIGQVGLKPSDVTLINFPTTSASALAFIKGVGDYYMGDLPEETKILTEFPDKFVMVGGADLLGPAGLWYSTMSSQQSWLDSHKSTALKMMAVWYRMMRILNDRPDSVMPQFASLINAQIGSNFTPSQVEYTVTHLDDFFTLQQAANTAFSPQSPLYWKTSADFYAKADASSLPSNFNVPTYILDNTYFEQLLADKSLVNWINSPLS